MALAYPEGEVFFKRDALKSTTYGFNAADNSSFYSHALVEYVWNMGFFTSNTSPSYDQVDKNPPARLKVYGDSGPGLSKTKYIFFKSWHIGYGNTRNGSSISRSVTMKQGPTTAEYDEANKGGPRKVAVRPVKFGPEKFMFIDLSQMVRAIYLPVSHQSDEEYPNMCTYLMINFTNGNNLSMYKGGGSTKVTVQTNEKLGLGLRIYETLGLDIQEIYAHLSLPRQLRDREKGLYKLRNGVYGSAPIQLWDHSSVATVHSESNQISFAREIDLAAVISANYGIDVTWVPFSQRSAITAFLIKLGALGIGAIPVIGPLLSISFTIGMTAITDPTAFSAEYGAAVGADLVNVIISSAVSARSNMPEIWQQALAARKDALTILDLPRPLSIAVEDSNDEEVSQGVLYSNPAFASRLPPTSPDLEEHAEDVSATAEEDRLGELEGGEEGETDKADEGIGE